MIFAGKLTDTLNFYKIVESQSGSGFKHSEEVFQFAMRAERLKNKENYLVNADELFHATELTFRLRNRKEIKENWIVKYEDEKYRITSLDRYPEENQLTIIVAKINE